MVSYIHSNADTQKTFQNFNEDQVTDFFEKEDFRPLSEAEERDVPSSTTTTTAHKVANVKKESLDSKEKQPEPRDLSQLTTVLNVTDADIEALVKTFSKLTGRNYIVDSSVKGKITIHLPTAITIEDALKVFDSILLLKGFATVPVGDNIWKVINAKDAKQTTIPSAYSKNTTSESLVTEILKTTHVSSDEIQKLVAQFISKDGFSQAISGTNLVILVDTTANIDRIKSLLNQIDIPPLDQDITIITIEHAEAKDVSEKISKILGEDSEKEGATNDLPISNNFLRRRLSQLNNAQNAQANANNTSGSSIRSTPMKIIPDERTNSIIVVADEFTTLKIRALAEQLDSQTDKSAGRFYVYRLEHADAEVLAQIISGLIGGGGSSGSSTSGTQGSSFSRNTSNSSSSNSSLGGANNSNSNSTFGGSNRSSSRSRASSSSGSGNTNNPSFFSDSSRVTFEDEISVAADPSTNSLIINSNKSDYEKLTQVIMMLDVKRRQVLVEATILEVSLTDEVGIGVELQGSLGLNDSGVISQTNFGNISNLLTNPSALSDLTLAAASVGTLTLPGGVQIPSQAAILSAVSRHSNVNVLSAPTILSTDNEEAEIIVGENVPFVSSTGTNQTNLSNTFNQIQRQDVGITLRITPQLGTGDFLSMKIFVEISNVVQGTRNDPNGPTTSIRTTDTLVAVKNGQMIVTGGLIQDSINESTRGIPFLEDIPVLGALFQRKDDTKRRTNLLIFLTPQIIHDQYDARDSTLQKRDNLRRELDEDSTTPEILRKLDDPALDKVFETGEIEDHRSNLPISEGPKPEVETIQIENKPIIKSSEQNEFNTSGFTYSKSTKNEKTASLPLSIKKFMVFKSLSAPYKTSVVYVESEDDLSTKFFTGSKASVIGSKAVCLGVFSSLEEASSIHKDLPQPLVIVGKNFFELQNQGLVSNE